MNVCQVTLNEINSTQKNNTDNPQTKETPKESNKGKYRHKRSAKSQFQENQQARMQCGKHKEITPILVIQETVCNHHSVGF